MDEKFDTKLASKDAITTMKKVMEKLVVEIASTNDKLLALASNYRRHHPVNSQAPSLERNHPPSLRQTNRMLLDEVKNSPLYLKMRDECNKYD